MRRMINADICDFWKDVIAHNPLLKEDSFLDVMILNECQDGCKHKDTGAYFPVWTKQLYLSLSPERQFRWFRFWKLKSPRWAWAGEGGEDDDDDPVSEHRTSVGIIPVLGLTFAGLGLTFLRRSTGLGMGWGTSTLHWVAAMWGRSAPNGLET